MGESAIVLAEGHFQSGEAKTAHGLVRGPARWRIAGVIDSTCAGGDAGMLLDGRARAIPVFASLREALARLPERPQWCVVGVATHGGRLPDELRASLHEAAQAGLSIANGLHELVSDDASIAALVARSGARIVDVRRPRPVRELAFWTGAALKLELPRVAVIGTDCALGKRTTTQLLVAECRARGLRAGMVYTGQTGWLQGTKHGFVLDSTPNDFVSGELERALLECVREEDPQVVFLEGQSALRNPSGPCGAELLLSAGARYAVLQHAPARRFYDGTEELGCVIPPLSDEIELLRHYQAEVLGVALNTEGLAPQDARGAARALEAELGLPVVLPLEDGVGRIVERLPLSRA
jgi:uncharacterized NAD-dependent epimerase/dehydratase family protein